MATINLDSCRHEFNSDKPSEAVATARDGDGSDGGGGGGGSGGAAVSEGRWR